MEIRVKRIDAYVQHVMPHFDINYLQPSTALNLDYSGDYNLYSQGGDRLKNFLHYSRGLLSWNWSRNFRLQLNGDVSDQPIDLSKGGGVVSQALYLGRNFKTIIQKSPVWLIVALFYGLGHYLVGVTVTTGIERLAAYSWPAFLLVALFFMKTYFEMDRESLVKISLVNLFVAWLPFGLEKAYGYNAILMLFIIAIALLAYFYVFGLLKRSANLRSLNEGKN